MSYVTKKIDFTQEVEELHKFVAGTSRGYGGDWAECYELALKQIREELSWREGL